VERVAKEGKPILTSDAQADERFNVRQSVMILGLRSILCVPLRVKEMTIGVIYVDNRLQAGIFIQQDLELLNAIASSAAIAIENARLYKVAIEKARLEQELQMARKVQLSLMPRASPRIKGWEFVALWEPAREVGGDYYDFIALDNGSLGIVIADVTDKGMPAALFMAFTRSIIRANLDHAISPSAGITRANRLICEESDHGLFVSLFYALLDPVQAEVSYVNAGHNPAVFVHHHQHAPTPELSCLSHTGMQMGIERTAAYEQKSISLAHGDIVVLYTDGVTEAINSRFGLFGLEGLQRVLVENYQKPASEIASAIKRAIAEFTGSLAPADDITVVIVKRL
jgi:sigma-B regulation protein RsbU (phosphoserine phosphatase)